MQSIAFKNFVTLQRGFDLPKKDMEEGDYPVIGSTSIIGYHNEYKVDPPGVITGRSGSLGQIQFINEPYWPHNTALWVRDFKGNHPKYVYYFLKTLNLERFNAGAGVPTLNRNHLDELEISIHAPETQCRIADMLSAYDDLIKNNTRRIRILEQMAQVIYQEWFGKVDKELLPDGWEVKPFGELLSFDVNGGWGEEEQSEQFSVPAYVIRGTDIPSGRYGQFDKVPFRYHKQSNFQSRQLLLGDIVIEIAGGSKGQPVGRALLIGKGILRSFNGQAICASFCKLVRPNQDIVSPEYLYMHLREIYQNGEIEKYQTQSTGIINFKSSFFLEDNMVIVSDKAKMDEFTEIIRPIFQMIETLGSKNTNLRRTRDLLLPRLISGEIELQ